MIWDTTSRCEFSSEEKPLEASTSCWQTEPHTQLRVALSVNFLLCFFLSFLLSSEVSFSFTYAFEKWKFKQMPPPPKKKKTPWSESASELYQPSDRRLSAK
jgi:hypothetical protein